MIERSLVPAKRKYASPYSGYFRPDHIQLAAAEILRRVEKLLEWRDLSKDGWSFIGVAKKPIVLLTGRAISTGYSLRKSMYVLLVRLLRFIG